MDVNKREAKRERWRRWAEKNRGSERERVRRWRQENTEKNRSYQQRYYAENQDAVSQRRREGHRVRRYGVTPERFAQLLAGQGGKCAVCATPEPRGKSDWHVDHDHATGIVRGILCITCNIALGMLHDDPARCRKAAEYLAFAELLK
jgi:hypothetical protein